MTRAELFRLLDDLYPERIWPKPLHGLQGWALVRTGADLPATARQVGTSAKRLTTLLDTADPVQAVLGLPLHEINNDHLQRARLILGQLLLGKSAEIAFEDIYRAEMHAHELELRDLREGRTDTDYRLYNGRGRPVYRLNIKFHGARFRRAAELVGLEPEDCFALATYKIGSALQKQHDDQLPYLFAIVGVAGLNAEAVGREVPTRFVEAVALMHQAPKAQRKRDFEDASVDYLVANREEVFQRTLERIEAADWYILSARRANNLLRGLLFERVFALRIRNFARVFRGAELDMHFSVTRDLTPLREFLKSLRDDGPQRVTTMLERGDY